MRKAFLPLLFALLVSVAQGQESFTVGVIDVYGLRTITGGEVRALLPFKEGDSVTPLLIPSRESEIAEALKVSRVEIELTCCHEPGVVVIYVGVEETPPLSSSYHAPPAGDAVLPREILETADEIDTTMLAAIRIGRNNEDWSQGHAFATDRAVRALQERYPAYAEEYRDRLLDVLRNSSHEEHRAIAASVMGYARDKKAIVLELERAVLDASSGVRNNATRALGVIATYADEHPELDIAIDPDVYIDMLSSVSFGDRNKASFVLSSLTSTRDPKLMAQLREKALPSLIEMCRWKVDGHSFSPCRLLERVVGLTEEDELHPKDRTIAMALELLTSVSER